MTIQERQERARMKRRKQLAKRKMFFLLVAIFVITLGSIVFGSIFSSAKDPDADIPRYKYYKSITIEQGDSLWSIAGKYMKNGPYDSRKEFMEEIAELNQLTSTKIIKGQNLIVPYFEDTYK